MSLRLRISLLTALLTLVVVGVAGAVVVLLVNDTERDRVDEQLHDAAVLVARRGLAARAGEGSGSSRVADPAVVGRMLDDGTTVFEVGAMPPGFDTVGAPPDGYTSDRFDGTPWRILRAPVQDVLPQAAPGRATDTSLVVEVAAPLTDVRSTVASLRRLVVRTGLAAVVAAGLLGWLLGGLALRPLARLRRDAERVSGTEDLEVGVADDQGLREIDELGHSLNLMLERIREATRSTELALEASRSFAANAAHELRTPLTSMQANLDVLERNPELPQDERASIVADVQAQQARLLQLLGALRLLARGDLESSPVDTDVDLADLVAQSVERAHRRHPHATIGLDIQGERFGLRGWPEGLEVMVDNLLDNAADHGRRADGTVHVDVEVAGPPERPGELTLVIADDGPGIPADERAHVFERFGRGRAAARPGSGLGLALVHQQVLLHGGTVTLDAGPRGGARFSARLPALDQPVG